MSELSRFQKINGNTLKIIACITMLIDHITAGIMFPVVRSGLYTGDLTIDQLNFIYMFLRGVGRTAFPIFCFLLVEGFMHTRSRLRYALSLLLFGIISEIPFDLIFFSEEEIFNINIVEALEANSYLLMDQCNVYFTLLLGLLVIWGMDVAYSFCKEKNLHIVISWLAYIVIALLGCGIAYKINSDYDVWGVVLILIFYLLRKYEFIRILAGYFFISQLGIEYWAFPGFILMALYSHKRGRNLGNLKYFFYVFYPVHLTLIYIIRCLIWG
ncbi:MAG: conjugal transfer protein TraX [Butyrivibrio sp.]|uniref:TraX family protein n=1 Tax=Butyrivibrio sp. TaxID=28121 RepID=UPI0025C61498|nr:TraX family protein [Butyrivibrio sp.]MBQ6589505.1 conjugal transfer protein TraX [Butyrivibrio sp.]